MSQPSAKSFLKRLERSGIVEENRLKQELANLSTIAAGRTVNLAELASHLIDSGLITRWHTEKLLAGKYKGFFLGKYKLLGHLGSGGMSNVYLAQHRVSGQFRAIKVLPKGKVSDKSYLDRFYLEARAAASLNHPNVVRIYDICKAQETHYMVMEYVKGRDLYEIVKENGPLSFTQAAEVTIQAAEGLIHAHQRKLVHRDIKPANLLKTDRGDVKILDLGLALVNQDDSESLTVLYNEKVMGTADYLSPEQAVNSHQVDHRADIYSLGCTLYFLLTGHPPFPNGTLAQRIAMHQSQTPADIRDSRPSCPAALVQVCQKMMNKDVEGRYNSCRELKLELLKVIESGELDESARFESRPKEPSGEISSAAIGPLQRPAGNSVVEAVKPATASVPNKHGPQEDSLGKGNPETHSKSIALPKKKRKKKSQKWILPATILAMFAILVIVLTVVNILIQKDNPPTEARPRMDAKIALTRLIGGHPASLTRNLIDDTC